MHARAIAHQKIVDNRNVRDKFHTPKNSQPASPMMYVTTTYLVVRFVSHLVALSNDPDKNCSIFYCSAAIRFPRVETVECAEEEFINQWKAGL